MDIVERLKDAAFRGPTMEAVHLKDIRWKAAEEIERLREALRVIRDELGDTPMDSMKAHEIADAALKEGE
jgi:hypothetical protein